MSAGFDSLAARLLAAARHLGAARAESLALARRDLSARWRRPALLWPLFTKGPA